MNNEFTKYDKLRLRQVVEQGLALSHSKEKQVAVMLCRDDRIICDGVNGTSVDEDNCCENYYNECMSCSHTDQLLGYPRVPFEHVCSNCGAVSKYRTQNVLDRYLVIDTKPNTWHAEINMFGFCLRHGINTDGTTMYSSLAPCEKCAPILITGGVIRVVYYEDFKRSLGVELLREAGIEVIKGDI